jgi:hypothetical protein
MNPESSLKLQTLEKFPVLMTKEKVAEALGVATHMAQRLLREPFGISRWAIRRHTT